MAVSLTGGTATAGHAYAAPSIGPYAVTAEYGGDLYFTASAGTDSQTVGQASTTTTVNSAPIRPCPDSPSASSSRWLPRRRGPVRRPGR
ncbi:hypothetical protein SVIO_019200 [Streptomyces violaceusniger]|uniref:Uncharacterized protein n=1 Tax=Streptomyces violaceusniger TaxID=68280 RepID=A0A4D4KXN7_STRVO|nr:hypothetical protein SVIO_019200 [Streptomyces violaceusniger]